MFGIIFPPIIKLLHIILGVNTPHNFPPPLDAHAEAEAFREARAGSEDARQELILHNLRLVSHIVRKYYSTAKNQDGIIFISAVQDGIQSRYYGFGTVRSLHQGRI